MNANLRSSPMEILLVEDGLTDARMTIFAIRRCGVHHRITLVRNLKDARNFISRRSIFAQAPKVDLLLLDLMLPDGSGTDLLRWIRERSESDSSIDDPPTTVVLTASPNEETRVQCKELGAADFLAKPVQQEAFMRLVREHKRLMIHTTATEEESIESTSLLTITP